jgi:exodeoxyribonuclease-3
VRLVAWNLLHGGGERIPRLVDALVSHEPDVCVLAETRQARMPQLLQLMRQAGFPHVATTMMPARKNGVAVFSRTRLSGSPSPSGDVYRQRWLETTTVHGFRLLASHVPPKISIGVDQKHAFWETLLTFARLHVQTETIIIGDLNTGAPYRDEHRATLYCAEQFDALTQSGWIDAWRHFNGPNKKEWSWAYPNRPSYGYRLDHAFCSPALAKRLKDCRYSHIERHIRLSDHSILTVDLATTRTNVDG